MTELRVSPGNAESLLHRQIERGCDLRQELELSLSKAAYERWRFDRQRWGSMTTETLGAIYGNDSTQPKELEDTEMLLAAADGRSWQVDADNDLRCLESAINVLSSMVERLELAELAKDGVGMGGEEVDDQAPCEGDHPEGVFIVHGRNDALRESAARVVEKVKRRAVILHEQTNRGRTLIEKFEQYAAEVRFAVILLTADDWGGASPDDLRRRARQNVVFEMGFFHGRLGRRQVVVLYEPGVETPSNIDGLVYIEADPAGAWKTRLLEELELR